MSRVGFGVDYEHWDERNAMGFLTWRPSSMFGGWDAAADAIQRPVVGDEIRIAGELGLKFHRDQRGEEWGELVEARGGGGDTRRGR